MLMKRLRKYQQQLGAAEEKLAGQLQTLRLTPESARRGLVRDMKVALQELAAGATWSTQVFLGGAGFDDGGLLSVASWQPS